MEKNPFIVLQPKHATAMYSAYAISPAQKMDLVSTVMPFRLSRHCLRAGRILAGRVRNRIPAEDFPRFDTIQLRFYVLVQFWTVLMRNKTPPGLRAVLEEEWNVGAISQK